MSCYSPGTGLITTDLLKEFALNTARQLLSGIALYLTPAEGPGDPPTLPSMVGICWTDAQCIDLVTARYTAAFYLISTVDNIPCSYLVQRTVGTIQATASTRYFAGVPDSSAVKPGVQLATAMLDASSASGPANQAGQLINCRVHRLSLVAQFL